MSPLKHILLILLLSPCLLAQAAGPAPAQSRPGESGYWGILPDAAGAKVLNDRPALAVGREARRRPPAYARIPPRHRRAWSRFCVRYGACSTPVMFVREDWYERVYAPSRRERVPEPSRYSRPVLNPAPPPGGSAADGMERGRPSHRPPQARGAFEPAPPAGSPSLRRIPVRARQPAS